MVKGLSAAEIRRLRRQLKQKKQSVDPKKIAQLIKNNLTDMRVTKKIIIIITNRRIK